MSADDYLSVPDAAFGDPQSFEILRVWIAQGGQHVSLRTKVWEDPAAWGLMLADLAAHIVNSYEKEQTEDRVQILRRLRSAFDVELDSPTDIPRGR